MEKVDSLIKFTLEIFQYAYSFYFIVVYFLLILFKTYVYYAHFHSSFISPLFFSVPIHTSFHKRTPSTQAYAQAWCACRVIPLVY